MTQYGAGHTKTKDPRTWRVGKAMKRKKRMSGGWDCTNRYLRRTWKASLRRSGGENL